MQYYEWLEIAKIIKRTTERLNDLAVEFAGSKESCDQYSLGAATIEECDLEHYDRAYANDMRVIEKHLNALQSALNDVFLTHSFDVDLLRRTALNAGVMLASTHYARVPLHECFEGGLQPNLNSIINAMEMLHNVLQIYQNEREHSSRTLHFKALLFEPIREWFIQQMKASKNYAGLMNSVHEITGDMSMQFEEDGSAWGRLDYTTPLSRINGVFDYVLRNGEIDELNVTRYDAVGRRISQKFYMYGKWLTLTQTKD